MRTRASPSPSRPRTLPARDDPEPSPARSRARPSAKEDDKPAPRALAAADLAHGRRNHGRNGVIVRGACAKGLEDAGASKKAGSGSAASAMDAAGPAPRVDPHQVGCAEGGPMERSNPEAYMQETVSRRGGTDAQEGMSGFQKRIGDFAAADVDEELQAAKGGGGGEEEGGEGEAEEEEEERGKLNHGPNHGPSSVPGPADQSSRGGCSLQEVVSRQAHFLQNHQRRQQASSSVRSPPAIRWERFLPQYQLRILLVEDDDSTRHVVTALLRNCSYEVTPAASGLLAWGLLVTQSCQFDIVLTEVVMSGLSGIALLSRIMGRETLKHIPVVMMSSHDSMGIVFKCLSMGAVDFLVKPVRKNELKNLWQHVWRRCRSSSGSGSDCGSGSRTRKASHHHAVANGDDNSNGNTDNENTSSEMNLRGGSDNGSGTQLQGSWTKRAVEVESSQNATFDPLTVPTSGVAQYDKGCSQKLDRIGLDTSSDALGNNLNKTSLRLAQNEPSFSCDKEQGVVGRAVGMTSDEAVPMEDDAGSTQDSIKAIDLTCKSNCNGEEQQGESADVEVLLENHASNSPSCKEKFASDSSSPSTMELMFNNPSSILRIDNERDREGRTPGLRHSCSSAFSRYNNSSGCHAMKSSDAENPQTGAGHGTSVYQSSVAASAAQMQRIMPTEGSEFSTKPPPYLSHGSHTGKFQDKNAMLLSVKDGEIMSSKGDNEPSLSHHLSDLERASSCPGKFYDSVKNLMMIPMGPTTAVEQIEGDDGHHSVVYGPGDSYQRSQQVHHHTHYHKHHHHHHVEHHFHFMSEMPQIDSQTVTNGGSGPPKSGPSSSVPGPNNGQSGSSNNNGNNGQSGSSNNNINNGQSGSSNDDNGNNGQRGSSNDNNGNNGQTGSCNDNNGNNGQTGSSNDNNGNNGQTGSSNNDNNGNHGQTGSSNNDNEGSATRSNNASNGHSNGQSAIVMPSLENGESMVMMIQASNEEGEEGVGKKCQVSAPLPQPCPDLNRTATREAALTKFRQKRKERCFEKKVRYQSRKRLAEQRPRVRGQFVRQSVYDFTVGKPE